jgi:hypothetical protein
MSTISLWNKDLGAAVIVVTRLRDGFRNSSDERSNVAVVVYLRYGSNQGEEVRIISAAVAWLR